MNQNIIIDIGITILLLCVTVQPAIATIQKETIPVSTFNPDEKRYLANFTMDFSENITNNRIEYDDKNGRPSGDWTINVKINFNCPENLKIAISYSYFAEMIDTEILEEITFCDIKESLIVLNGSNPPDINIDHTKYCPNYFQHEWDLTLIIQASLTAYEFIDGEWVKIHNYQIYNETTDVIFFNRIRSSERTETSDDDCNVCPKKVSKSHIIILKNLISRLEKRNKQVSVILKQYPELEEKYQELSELYTIIKNKTELLDLQRPYILRFSLCVITFTIWVIILAIPFIIAVGLSGTYFDDAYWAYIIMPLLYVYVYTTRFVCKPFLPEE